ncbi:hypothetical protein K469DRAFT_688793 [Zopfia rhizophila CBS 207.26]|uniref:Uncharacterized protein n=1 Tax=Zopfia rhizophila CBS 207.26 TaxID=1314779 RepID=A0A6A6DZ48_9PEZI|nr:hypothetical protein K469DRAFT_688793 [Zopfia rhizophila CBS 207.26]
MISYDECGKLDKIDGVANVSEYKQRFFTSTYTLIKKTHSRRLMRDPNTQVNEDLQDIYEDTSFALAADRSTRFLRVLIAEAFFIATWAIALLRASSSEQNPSNWVNVEAHSIAFSAMYLWVTSAVTMGAVIGAPQTAGAVPRLLQRFEYDIRTLRSGYTPTSFSRRAQGSLFGPGLFWIVFMKDTFFPLSNIALLIVYQWGSMNRCSCWDMWGLAGLVLPEMPEIKATLMSLIKLEFPWVILGAILFQLAFCAVVAWKYWDAVRVFVQRDDGASKLDIWRISSRDRRASAQSQSTTNGAKTLASPVSPPLPCLDRFTWESGPESEYELVPQEDN